MASYIRLHPRTYTGSPSLRFDLQGFGPLADYIGDIHEPNFSCAPLLGNRLGVANRSVIPDSSISASRYYGSRLRPFNGLFGDFAWAPLSTDQPGWWWKVDLDVVYLVTGVITQGRKDQLTWITSYKLSLSLDDAAWVNVGEDECGSWKEFPANCDRESLVTNLFLMPLSARFVKLYPITYYDWPSLRCEILGFLE